jgi:predicted O-methyltransferase YrrM
MNTSKAIRLLALLPKRPLEFYDRLMTVVEVTKDRRRAAFRRGIPLVFTDALSLALGVSSNDIAQLLAESELQRLEEKVLAGIKVAKGTGPFDSGHNGNFCLARSIYVLCRLLSPNVVFETGVAYGVTSAFTLQALAVNRKGTLISVDLPPLGGDADKHVGALVPLDLRERWHLHRGPAKRVLPNLVSSTKEVDIFVHDSLHTYHHMNFEFETVWPKVRRGGAVVADNVDLNEAFDHFTAKVCPTFSAVVQEEDTTDLFGIMIKRL